VAAPEAFETLTSVESDALEAMVARIIPTDANGPGAKEARAAHYIDRALGGALTSSRAAYAAGLESLDRSSRSSSGKLFAELSPGEQDVILADVERGTAAGFAAGSATAFFNMVRTHTIQGTFCDPYYGGNANFVGWDLIGYPGVRTMVTSDEQRMTRAPSPTHKSAYDFEMFTKASARVGPGEGIKEGMKEGVKEGVKGAVNSGD
jgi:gluconate 2-dehydrogenase gamma chain